MIPRFFLYPMMLLTLTMLGACSSGIDRKVLEEDILLPQARGASTKAQANRIAQKIANARRTRRNTKLPLALAVHLYESDNENWRWTAGDRGEIAAWGRELKTEGIIDSMFVMSALVSTGSSLDEIRLAAARHGGDAVLVLKTSAELDAHLNPLSLFYLTLVGYFIFPGSSADALMLSNGVVLDVDSGKPYMSINAEGAGSTFAPGGFLNESKAMDRAKAETLKRLKPQFLEGMREVARKLVRQKARQKKINKKKRRTTRPRSPGIRSYRY